MNLSRLSNTPEEALNTADENADSEGRNIGGSTLVMPTTSSPPPFGPIMPSSGLLGMAVAAGIAVAAGMAASAGIAVAAGIAASADIAVAAGTGSSGCCGAPGSTVSPPQAIANATSPATTRAKKPALLLINDT